MKLVKIQEKQTLLKKLLIYSHNNKEKVENYQLLMSQILNQWIDLVKRIKYSLLRVSYKALELYSPTK